MKKMIRGQEITIIDKVVYVEIYRPKKSAFSLADKIVEYQKRGFTIKVKLPTGVQTITPDQTFFKKETVPSKFGGNPWHRYWFTIKVSAP